MNFWMRFRQWRQHRLCRRLVYASAGAMLMLAAEQFRDNLTEAEKDRLVRALGRWLTNGGDARLLNLIDQPIRTLHLFLSEVIQ